MTRERTVILKLTIHEEQGDGVDHGVDDNYLVALGRSLADEAWARLFEHAGNQSEVMVIRESTPTEILEHFSK